MSRKLYVSADISVDEALAEIADTDPLAALLWPWLLVHLDDWGRSSASPRRLKGSIAPMMEAVTTEVIKRALQAFKRQRLIALYTVDGQEYLAVNPDKWWRYQTHIHKEKRGNDQSMIPAPPADSFTVRAESRGKSRSSAEKSASLPPSTLTTPPPTTSGQPDMFEAFWKMYPRKEGKGPAREAFAKACRQVDGGRIVAGLKRQLPAFRNREKRFIAMPATWLNQGRWDDEPDGAKQIESQVPTRPVCEPVTEQDRELAVRVCHAGAKGDFEAIGSILDGIA